MNTIYKNSRAIQTSDPVIDQDYVALTHDEYFRLLKSAEKPARNDVVIVSTPKPTFGDLARLCLLCVTIASIFTLMAGIAQDNREIQEMQHRERILLYQR